MTTIRTPNGFSRAHKKGLGVFLIGPDERVVISGRLRLRARRIEIPLDELAKSCGGMEMGNLMRAIQLMPDMGIAVGTAVGRFRLFPKNQRGEGEQ